MRLSVLPMRRGISYDKASRNFWLAFFMFNISIQLVSKNKYFLIIETKRIDQRQYS
jgi:hypothetical protein